MMGLALEEEVTEPAAMEGAQAVEEVLRAVVNMDTTPALCIRR